MFLHHVLPEGRGGGVLDQGARRGLAGRGSVGEHRWAPWCGPCKQLTPIIEKAVKDAGGKVKLVKMNIDEHSMKALIWPSGRAPMKPSTGWPRWNAITAGIDWMPGDTEAAAEIYAAVLGQEPGHAGAIAALARLILDRDGRRGRPPARRARSPPAPRRWPGPWRPRAAPNRGTLGLNAKGQQQEAVDQLIEIVRRDRTWNEDGARKVESLRRPRMVIGSIGPQASKSWRSCLRAPSSFQVWGPMDPMTIRGRRKLSTLMFS
jgi:putative thioredoxin